MATREQRRNARAERIIKDMCNSDPHLSMIKYRFLIDSDLEVGVVVSSDENHLYSLTRDRRIKKLETDRFNYSSANMVERASLIGKLRKYGSLRES